MKNILNPETPSTVIDSPDAAGKPIHMSAVSSENHQHHYRTELLPDEYINPADGLIYCSRCHTPRQGFFPAASLGKAFTPRLLCECQKEQREKETLERIEQEKKNQITRLRAVGLHEKNLQGFRFENDNGLNPKTAKARAYVNHWDELKTSSEGLLIWGPVGTGKTFLAGCIANALIDKGVPVLMTNFSDILDKLSGMYPDQRNEFINSFDDFNLLIIDDVGMERKTDYALEHIFRIVDNRYRSKQPLIVTTNLTLCELRDPVDLKHERIYSRLLEMCVPVLVDGLNFRKVNSKRKMEHTQKLLSSPPYNAPATPPTG